ncbi:hypothetical protein NXS19_003027 [Fusarium pseudograminearum]|nr:hypothetical protein NXS19_003027 [Fusarium pseudograminearum]
MNTHDQLMQHCSKSLDYPCNLQEPCQPRRTLDGYRKMLIKAYKCDQETFTRPAGLQKHLLQNREDPHTCLIFLESSDSRAPLNCSYESFVY